MTPTALPAAPDAIDDHIAELSAQVATYRHGRVPADLRRRHILAIAFRLFAERSFPDASMDELAARAGVSKPVIYGLVGDKERIFRFCVELATEALADQVRRAMRAEREPEASLRAGARAFFLFVAEAGPGWDRIMTTRSGPVSAELSAARRRQADVVAELLAELLETLGVPADPAQLEAVAHAMNGACEALALWWRRHPERRLDEIVELAGRLVTPGVLDVATRPLERWGPGEP